MTYLESGNFDRKITPLTPYKHNKVHVFTGTFFSTKIKTFAIVCVKSLQQYIYLRPNVNTFF